MGCRTTDIIDNSQLLFIITIKRSKKVLAEQKLFFEEVEY